MIDNVSVKVGNCVPNSVFNVDYRALELENLRSNKSLVQIAEEQIGNLGLFAEKDQQITMTMQNILFDLRCNNHNIYSSFRK